ncbi:MAG: imidazoleglycerol-phosphate dehydratase, partial [Verrucomicrobiota bacterium]
MSQGKRQSKKIRKTSETEIAVTLGLDGKGSAKVKTGIPFFDHMLNLFARHGLFDLEVKAKGDLDVDLHHTVEDVGIVLGQALTAALGKKEGIRR